MTEPAGGYLFSFVRLPPAVTDALGIAGIALYIGAYLLLQLGLIRSDRWPYPTANFFAAFFLFVSLTQKFNPYSMTNEIAWMTISLIGLGRLYIVHRYYRFTEEERTAVARLAPGLAKDRARKLLSCGTWSDVDAGHVLTRQGTRVTHLVYLASGQQPHRDRRSGGRPRRCGRTDRRAHLQHQPARHGDGGDQCTLPHPRLRARGARGLPQAQSRRRRRARAVHRGRPPPEARRHHPHARRSHIDKGGSRRWPPARLTPPSATGAAAPPTAPGSPSAPTTSSPSSSAARTRGAASATSTAPASPWPTTPPAPSTPPPAWRTASPSARSSAAPARRRSSTTPCSSSGPATATPPAAATSGRWMTPPRWTGTSRPTATPSCCSPRPPP